MMTNAMMRISDGFLIKYCPDWWAWNTLQRMKNFADNPFVWKHFYGCAGILVSRYFHIKERKDAEMERY